MRKPIKNMGLAGLICSISCVVTNWGNELTHNPVFVTIALVASALMYIITDALDD